ncbi:MAG TPA: porin [Polyangia bacterium]
MRRFRVASVSLSAAVAAASISVPLRATADVTFHNKEGWKVYTAGLISAQYQLATGDGDPPTTHGVLVGGKLLPGGARDTRDDSVTLSRIRSGFVGTQIGFGIVREISEETKVDAFMAVSLNDIGSNRGQTLPKGVDFREAWASLTGSFGSFKFGRMFSIFGSASAPIVLLAHQYGVGNPCYLNEATIACASVGAGPLYAGFDAQVRYHTPRMGGFELQVAISDPVVGPAFQITPQPRFDGEVNYDQEFGESSRLRLWGQGMTEEIRRVNGQELQVGRVWGAMGAGLANLGNFAIGGGGWTGAGIGVRQVMEIIDAANPLAYDSEGTLRKFRGFFGNASYTLGSTTIAAGGGAAYVQPTSPDIAETSSVNVLNQSIEMHVTLAHKFDQVIFTAEYMQWKNSWYFGEQQILNFAGAGANFVW